MDFSIRNQNPKHPVIKKIERTTEIEPIKDNKEKGSKKRTKEENAEKKHKNAEEIEDELGSLIDVKW
ncbi:hypothetical protein R3O67_33335 [Bacillus cereus]|uniref:hypothetical protein n=1 Tax=Bacillus cereus TaxID=1396 RepID=UPI00307A7F7F